MSEWQRVTIGECCDILDSQRIPVNGEERSKRIGTIPYYGANGLQGYIDDYIFDEPLILMAEDGGYFDEFATRPVAYRISGKSWVNNHAHVLRAIKGHDQSFVFYSLEHKDVTPFIKGGTRAKLNQLELRLVSIQSPPLPEQRKIARILTTVDNLIEKTEALIEKYKSIKQGMMHDLFTRGVDSTGQLRPPYEDAPHLYKQSPLGWIPNEWEVEKCDSLCREIVVGIVIQPTQYYTAWGVPVLRSANVREDGINGDDLVFMSEESNRILSKSMVRRGDVVTVRTGYPGTSSVIDDEFDGANCVDIIISRPTSQILSEFLAFWINSDFGKTQVLRTQGGLALQHFNVGALKELLVAVPQMPEQAKIEEILLNLRHKEARERDSLAKSRRYKTGLMQDLLTGKVRVNVDEAEEVTADV